jgi:transposase
MSRFEQRAVIHYLTLKNLSVTKIATELQNMYGMDALKDSTVLKWRLRFQDGSDDLFDLARSKRRSRSDLAALIQSLLQQFPFISCKVKGVLLGHEHLNIGRIKVHSSMTFI